MTKVVIFADQIIAQVIGKTGAEHRRLANQVMEKALNTAKVDFQSVLYVVSTGYGRINVPFADKQITEITCHAKGISYLIPEAKTIIDIGGQDCKAITINPSGKPTDFVMNDKCAAGSGRFIEVIADTLGIHLDDVGRISLQSKAPASISNICTIWAQQEVSSRISEGTPIEDILSGVHHGLSDRIVRMANRLRIQDPVALTGGGAKNPGMIKALAERLEHPVQVPEEPLISGALGAALLGKEIFEEAEKNHQQLEIKKRILERVEIL